MGGPTLHNFKFCYKSTIITVSQYTVSQYHSIDEYNRIESPKK
jgi:hypothetical protein